MISQHKGVMLRVRHIDKKKREKRFQTAAASLVSDLTLLPTVTDIRDTETCGVLTCSN